ncbi:hypothetical protein ACFVJH_10255 [Streptomyces decoyicus]|uniref:hypothetical protein n=1 Tax=Streptomyces decoyicus TaxID=249567 RepID=UPI00362F314F
MSETDWELFLRDTALCLSTYQGTGPAMVWPERAHAILPMLLGTFGGGPADAGWRPAPPGAGANRLAARLGDVIGRTVEAFERWLLAGSAISVDDTSADVLLFPVRGGARCRIDCRDHAAHAQGGLELRLRAGEIVYAPAGHACTLSGASAPCPLLLLVLRATP